MESVATRSLAPRARLNRHRFDVGGVSVWALVGAIVLYLSIDGGGFDIVVRSQAGIVVWWVVLIGAALGVLPAGRVSRSAWAGIALFGGFAIWTALATTWSESTERSLEELSRVACYLGILLLAIGVHRERERAVRHTVNALASAIVLVAALALASRLRPGLFPAANQTGSFLPGTQGRLAWPLNYWNALAALVAIGLPLVLAISSSAKTVIAQAAAAAAVPMLALCAYLTFSRGGAITIAAAAAAYLLLAPQRLPKLATVLATGAGSAFLIAGAEHRSAIEHGLATATAKSEGDSLILAVILVCAGVALAQVGIGLAVRHATPPRWLQIPVGRARALTGVAVVGLLVIALAAGGPSRLSHAWDHFKTRHTSVLQQDSVDRFGSISGNGRYDLWKVAVSATTGSHLLDGHGPGTFQLVWLPRAPYYTYVENAHSLYLETLSDDGIIGLALLGGFFVLVLAAAVRLVVRTRDEARVRAAGVAAGLLAFCISAIYEWIWQVPALPAAFLLLAGAVLAPTLTRGVRGARAAGGAREARAGQPRRRIARLAGAAAIIVAAVASLIAIAVPLATTNAVRSSQAAVSHGDRTQALTDALAAARIESGAATPQLQAALVLEVQGRRGQALTYALRATKDEPGNWSAWLIVSRLEAETGHAHGSLVAFRRARSLNPRSPVFRQ